MQKHGSRLTQIKISRRAALAGMSAGLATLAMPRISRAADDTIRIGFPTPLTGPFAAEARDQVKCAELAVKLVNDKGGIAGRKVELLVRDDKLNAGEAATRTLELIEKDKVHAVVGALSSAVQLAVNEVTRARSVIYVSISQSDTINEAKDFSKYTFHEALNPHMTTAAVARQTMKKGMKVAHLVADYAYGHEMLRGFKRAQATIGAQNAGEILHPLGAADYSTFMPRLMSMRPDVLCISNFGRDQANAINYYWGLETQSKSAAEFNAAFRAANGGAIPTDYGAYGYSGVASLLLAMQAAGGTDTDKVVDALEKLKYDLTKGQQHYRKCDHQSVQSVLVLESKKKAAMANDNDMFAIVANDAGTDGMLRSCSELGHPA
jgi:branched-chain amino acid transport system substrate-binding protein